MLIEAIEDGIRFVKNEDSGGGTYYYPVCHVCGIREVKCLSYKKALKYTCKECKIENTLKERKNRNDMSFIAKQKKLENALKRMNIICVKNSVYERAYNIVNKNLGHEGWFQSTEEIMVALELLKQNIKVRHQVKFGRYKADFVLPEEKIVLEVDGMAFHNKSTVQKEIIRDNLIILSLGADWEVIRISDKNINTNVKKILTAIKQVKLKRAKMRKLTGELPAWYSERK